MIFLRLLLLCLIIVPSQLFADNKIVFSAIEKSSYATISERVLQEAYNRLGIKLVVNSLPAQRAISDANSGISDGELYRIKNIHLKYKNLLMVPIPVGIMEGVAITKNAALDISGWDDLASHRVCIRNGVKFAEAGTRNIKAHAVNSNDQLFRMLGENRCEVIIIAHLTSIPLGLNFTKREGTKIYHSVLQIYPLYHYLHKKNAKLLPSLSKVLKEMENEGVISKIRSDYIAEISE